MEKIKYIKDVEKTHIKGDVVITDPCYLDYMMEHDEDWMHFISKRKIPSLVKTSTLFGDWSCTLFNVANQLRSPRKIGNFTADAGMVCCCTLEDVLKFNPKFQEYIDKYSHCVAIVKKFEGDVYFRKYQTEYLYEGKLCKDYLLKVEGCGKKNGKHYKFCSEQTGL